MHRIEDTLRLIEVLSVWLSFNLSKVMFEHAVFAFTKVWGLGTFTALATDSWPFTHKGMTLERHLVVETKHLLP